MLGTTFGGDGKTTFNLPNLQGAVPVQAGQGPGLSAYNLGQVGGANSVALSLDQMPAHLHTPQKHERGRNAELARERGLVDPNGGPGSGGL